jgi:hypothetical protein
MAFDYGQRLCAWIEFMPVETLVTMHHLVRQFRWWLFCKANTFVRDSVIGGRWMSYPSSSSTKTDFSMRERIMTRRYRSSCLFGVWERFAL